MKFQSIPNCNVLLNRLFMAAGMVFILLFSNAYADSEYVVVCNSANPITSISKVNLMNIFLGKKATWDDGKKITFVTLKEGDSHKQFLRNHVKKNPQQFKNYWKKMLFTGKGVIPRSFSDDAGVLDFVSKNEAAIGYISNEAISDGVKMLQIGN